MYIKHHPTGPADAIASIPHQEIGSTTKLIRNRNRKQRICTVLQQLLQHLVTVFEDHVKGEEVTKCSEQSQTQSSYHLFSLSPSLLALRPSLLSTPTPSLFRQLLYPSLRIFQQQQPPPSFANSSIPPSVSSSNTDPTPPSLPSTPNPRPFSPVCCPICCAAAAAW